MDKANFSPDLYQAIEKLKPHNHLCLIYENQAEQFNVAIPFIKMGLERHEKCIYIVDDNKLATIKKEMRAQGIKVDDAIKSNQLSIIDKQDSYLKLGKFDPDWMIQFLKETTKAALDEGYAALRVTGEMTWALGGDPGNENLFEYESKLNKFFPKNACLDICQYNRKRFSPEIILNVIRTHPFAIFRGDIYTNYFFIHPDLFNTKNQPKQEVTQLLEGLQTLKWKETNLISSEQIFIKKEETLEKEKFERKRAQEFLEENQKRYHILFESISSGVAVYEAVDDGSDFIFKDFNSAAERIERTPREKVIGRKVTEVFPGIREMTLLETFQRVWKTGKPENHPAAIYKDKHLVGWRENYVYKLPSGEIVAVYEDISERKKAKLAIAESESKYKWLYINAPIPYHILSADGIIMDINQRWCEVLGYTRKEALGRDIFDFIVEEERDTAKLSFKNKKASKKTYVEGSERNYRTKTGVIKTFKTYDHLVLDQNQNITSVQTTIEDITERKKKEEQIRYHATLLDNINDAIIAADENSKITAWNAAAESLYGWKAEKVLGRIRHELLKTEYPNNNREEVLATIVRTGKWRGEITRVRKDGVRIPIEESSMVMKDENGKILYFVDLNRDITERKRIEAALSESEAKLRSLFASMKDLVIVYNKEGRYLNIATTDSKSLIKSPEDLLGKTIYEVFPKKEADRFVLHIKTVLRTQKTIPIEYSFEINHHKVWFEASVSPIQEDTVLWVARDITDRKLLEERSHFIGIHDKLTNLYNRTFYEEEVSRLEKSRLFPVSIFMIDLDDLKIANDTQGHAAGDELLQRTAKVLLKSFRAEDMVARIGGDEFVALLPKTNEEAAQSVFKRIKHFLKLNNKNNPNVLIISIGVATCDKQGSLAKTVKQADDRMYLDKRAK